MKSVETICIVWSDSDDNAGIAITIIVPQLLPFSRLPVGGFGPYQCVYIYIVWHEESDFPIKFQHILRLEVNIYEIQLFQTNFSDRFSPNYWPLEGQPGKTNHR